MAKQPARPKKTPVTPAENSEDQPAPGPEKKPFDPNADDVIEAARERFVRRRIDGFRQSAEDNNNPLYVWLAIVYCNACN